MQRTAYHKLVRDRIPQLIEASGRQAVVQQVDNQGKFHCLQEKLKEEISEYLQSNSLEELADILEVVHGLMDCMGKTWEELESVRISKKLERGGFEKGIFLMEIIEPGETYS